MTRHDHRGRFTAGTVAKAAPERGAPLLHTKNPHAVALGRMAHTSDRARVLRVMNALRRQLGLPEWKPNG